MVSEAISHPHHVALWVNRQNLFGARFSQTLTIDTVIGGLAIDKRDAVPLLRTDRPIAVHVSCRSRDC